MSTLCLARSTAKQDILGAVDARRQIRSPPDIRMHALNEPPMGRADLIGRGALLESEDRKRLVTRHVGTWTALRRSLPGSAPVGAEPPVEIGLEHPQRIGIACTFLPQVQELSVPEHVEGAPREPPCQHSPADVAARMIDPSLQEGRPDLRSLAGTG